MDGSAFPRVEKQGLDDWLLSSGAVKVKKTLPLLYSAATIVHERGSEAHITAEFARRLKSSLTYSPQRGWMLCTGVLWEADEDRNLRHQRVAEFAATLRRQVEQLYSLVNDAQRPWANTREEDHPKAVIEWTRAVSYAAKLLDKATKSLGTLRGLKTLLELAQSHLNVDDAIWDADPRLLGVRNGVVNLQTGQLLPADPELYITQCTRCAYDPAAECPVWLSFLHRVQPDAEACKNLQLLAGYSCTGETTEQAFFQHHGSGANGKSTFLRALGLVLGSYAGTAGAALIDRKSDHREQAYETAALVGRRLVTIAETESAADLAMSVVKRLTGEDTVSARHMHKSSFSFEPVCKLHLVTNHLPHVRDSTHGAWRRLRILEWPVQLEAHEIDPYLMQKLKAELPGILTWMVQGAVEYLRHGLAESARSRALKKGLRETADDVQQWIESRVLVEAGATVQSSVAYEDYRRWATAQGESAPRSKQVWAPDLEGKNFTKRKSSTGSMVWQGMRLRPCPEISETTVLLPISDRVTSVGLPGATEAETSFIPFDVHARISVQPPSQRGLRVGTTGRVF